VCECVIGSVCLEGVESLLFGWFGATGSGEEDEGSRTLATHPREP
jgi:hypothetical protein